MEDNSDSAATSGTSTPNMQDEKNSVTKVDL